MKFAKLLDNDSGIQKAAEVFKNHHAVAREIGEGWSCTNVPEDIKNGPKLDDDVIISDGEAVEELLGEDANNDFEEVQFLQLTSPKDAKVQ
ncbi:hypothetical protein AVEN_218677-1 [Araneus ventricosus]|uniref:Uncharacterized protein n=1 Tax=Araneus ventricosus TaxID=182803 RepID=A0A4Y2B559_ARAVE|nr:hypothetical protein AVEN_218677-1 [Araneus ventricosus]